MSSNTTVFGAQDEAYVIELAFTTVMCSSLELINDVCLGFRPIILVPSQHWMGTKARQQFCTGRLPHQFNFDFSLHMNPNMARDRSTTIYNKIVVERKVSL